MESWYSAREHPLNVPTLPYLGWLSYRSITILLHPNQTSCASQKSDRNSITSTNFSSNSRPSQIGLGDVVLRPGHIEGTMIGNGPSNIVLGLGGTRDATARTVTTFPSPIKPKLGEEHSTKQTQQPWTSEEAFSHSAVQQSIDIGAIFPLAIQNLFCKRCGCGLPIPRAKPAHQNPMEPSPDQG